MNIESNVVRVVAFILISCCPADNFHQLLPVAAASLILQDLLSDWDSFVHTLSGLSDQATSLFSTQAQKFTATAAQAHSAMTAIQDSLELAKQMQLKYVEQSLLMDASTAELWSCNCTYH